jgi:hypothetical protein
MKTKQMGLAGVATALVLASAVSGGPLTPPAGPVTPTNKTLQQVEPRTPIDSLPGTAVSMYKITQPGSYYLTGNISLAAGKTTCIEVAADGVTIDLSGFTLNGLNTNGTTAIRAEDKFFADGVRVHNGHITDWGTGIDGAGFTGLAVDSVRFTFCDSYGLDGGRGAVVTGCSALVCGAGFYLRAGGSISDSASMFCGNGIDLGDGGSATNCSAATCTYGVYMNVGSTARGCTASDCALSGFRGDDRNTLVDCTVSLGGDGIDIGQASRITGCHVGGGTGLGIGVSHGSTVERCTVNGQSLRGIIAGDKCSIRDNNIEFCGGVGVHVVGLSTMVSGNNVQRCQLDIGILIEGDDNQLEMNRVEGSGLEGIKVVGTRNLVIRNRVCASARTTGGLTYFDYNVPAGNHAGSLLLPASFVTTAEQNANYACGFVPPDPIRPGQSGTAGGAGMVPSRRPGVHPERATPEVPTHR